MKILTVLLVLSTCSGAVLLFWLMDVLKDIKFWKNQSNMWYQRADAFRKQNEELVTNSKRMRIVPQLEDTTGMMNKIKDLEKEVQDQAELMLKQDHMIVGQKATISRLIGENRMLLAGKRRYK
jgi:hypothetical protein